MLLTKSKQRIVVTGAGGLLGWHTCARLHAANCAAGFAGLDTPFDIVPLDHAGFDDDNRLESAVRGADAVIHYAGINRATDEIIRDGNPAIARRLVNACSSVGAEPHIVYANSTHAAGDSNYGQSKKNAAAILGGFTDKFTDMILPHIYGECAVPFYNNVTGTLIKQLIDGKVPKLNPEGVVNLFYAGDAAQLSIDSIQNQAYRVPSVDAKEISVVDLYEKLRAYHEGYVANIYPDFQSEFDVSLFNCYRAATYPDLWPRNLSVHEDVRGSLFEAVKGGGGGQTFLSTTEPGVTRGDHFHVNKVERFLVLQGEAIIRIRKVLSGEVWEYKVSGDSPSVVDMPTLHTHSIENIGTSQLTTLFWAHELFDPDNPDTYLDRVLPA